MALGFLEIEYQSNVVGYADEDTPLKLCGKKMLPIMQFPDGPINESLDIIKKLDAKNTLYHYKESDFKHLNTSLDAISGPLHSICMPYFIWTKEFDQSSREYFQRKKELKRGPFNELVKKRLVLEGELKDQLDMMVKNLNPFYASKQFSLLDIMLASHLWGLYIVPEFQFDEVWHSYLQRVKKLCHFDYHRDYWNDSNIVTFKK